MHEDEEVPASVDVDEEAPVSATVTPEKPVEKPPRLTAGLAASVLRKASPEGCRVILSFDEKEAQLIFALKTFSSELPDLKMPPISLAKLRQHTPLTTCEEYCEEQINAFLASLKEKKSYNKRKEKSESIGEKAIRVLASKKIAMVSSAFSLASGSLLALSRLLPDFVFPLAVTGLATGGAVFILSVAAEMISSGLETKKPFLNAIDNLEKEIAKIRSEIYLKSVVMLRLEKLFDRMPILKNKENKKKEKFSLNTLISVLENQNRIAMWNILNQNLKLILSKNDFFSEKLLTKKLERVLLEVWGVNNEARRDITEKHNSLLDCLLSLPLLYKLAHTKESDIGKLMPEITDLDASLKLSREVEKKIKLSNIELVGKPKTVYNTRELVGFFTERSRSNNNRSSSNDTTDKGEVDDNIPPSELPNSSLKPSQ